MSDYRPPVEDMRFVLHDVIGIDDLPQSREGTIDDEMVQAILDEAGKLASDVIAPLNSSGDRQGSRLEGGQVKTPDGFKAAYQAYCENGWNGVPFDPAYGGMGLPWALSFAVAEMWQSANMSFGLCPMLNQAAVEAMYKYGTEAQKDIYLEKLVSGQWTGTMNLTEPQAGSDLARIQTRAEKQEDGTYRLFGQKIYITYGDHDLTENIIHMVLARTPGAPEGIKGISMFVVPKYIPDAQGRPGVRNDLVCAGLEEKLGIHASPTCVMQFGEEDGATGYLIGQEHEGIKYMFLMMNQARLGVGLQGVALAERAYQQARAYAQERRQGTRTGDKTGGPVPIILHEDVRRMLLGMKALTEAGRALAYEAALMTDKAAQGDGQAQAMVELLTPLVKAWCTDRAVEVASTGIQIYGGMGFIEEAGAAQFYREARILPIYEGTNGIQALDLMFRKTAGTDGRLAHQWIAHARQFDLPPMLEAALVRLGEVTDMLAAQAKTDPQAAAAVAVPYQEAFGTIAGGVMMARSAQAAAAQESVFSRQKKATAAFYMSHILPRAEAALVTATEGAAGVMEFDPAWF